MQLVADPGFENYSLSGMGSVDIITTGEQENKAAMLRPSAGRNLALEDGCAACSFNSWKRRVYRHFSDEDARLRNVFPKASARLCYVHYDE